MHRSTAILGLLTALVTLGGIIVGLFAGKTYNQKNDLSSSLDDAQASLSSVQAANSSLHREVTDLESSNTALQSQLNSASQTAPSTSPGAPGPSGAAPSTAVTVRRSDAELVLPYPRSQAVDLDSKSDAQWRGPAPDIGWDVSQFQRFGGSTAFILPVSKTASYSTCHDSTSWGYPDLSTRTLEINQYFCLKTSENRYVGIKVLKMTQSEADIAVVVWDPPDNP